MAVDSLSRSARLRTHVREPLYRSAYALTLSALGSAGLGAVFWAVAAHLYHRAIVGESSAAIAALTFVSGVSGLYLDGSLYRFLPRAGRQAAPLVIVTTVITLYGGLLVSSIFLAGTGLWSPGLDFLRASPWVALACMVTTAATALLVLQDAALTGLRRTGWVPLKNLIYNFAKVPALFLFLLAAPRYGILLAWAVPTVVVCGVVAFLFKRKLLPRHREPLLDVEEEPLDRRVVARYASGNYVGYLCTLAYRTLPPIIVLHEAGAKVAAVFYPPWLITTSLSLIVTNMSVSLVVEGAYRREHLALHVRQALRQTARMLIPIVLFLLVAAPYILRVFGSEYADAGATLLRLLALSLVPSSICILGFGIARVRDDVRVIVVNQVLLAVLSLSLSAVLIGPLGLEGVGVAFIFSQTVVGAVLLVAEILPALGRRAVTVTA